MKLVETVQVQVMDGKELLVNTIHQYVEAMNFISEFARQNDIYSKNKIQSRIYQQIRDRFGLKAQIFRSPVLRYKRTGNQSTIFGG